MTRRLALALSMLLGLMLDATAASAVEAGPSVLPGDNMQLGQQVYRQSCASCHGENAEGAAGWQQADRNGELPAPPHNRDGHTWRHADGDLYEMIAKGWRDPFNTTNRLTMPAFEQTLPPEAIDAVIAYLKTLWTPEQRQFQLEKTQEALPQRDSNNGR